MKSSLTNTLLLQKLGELSKGAIHLLMNCLFVQKHFSKSQLRLSAPRNSLSHKKQPSSLLVTLKSWELLPQQQLVSAVLYPSVQLS